MMQSVLSENVTNLVVRHAKEGCSIRDNERTVDGHNNGFIWVIYREKFRTVNIFFKQNKSKVSIKI